MNTDFILEEENNMQIPKIDFTDPVADQEIVIKGPNDCPKREPAPVMLHIPYIINQPTFSHKSGQASPGFAYESHIQTYQMKSPSCNFKFSNNICYSFSMM